MMKNLIGVILIVIACSVQTSFAQCDDPILWYDVFSCDGQPNMQSRIAFQWTITSGLTATNTLQITGTGFNDVTLPSNTVSFGSTYPEGSIVNFAISDGLDCSSSYDSSGPIPCNMVDCDLEEWAPCTDAYGNAGFVNLFCDCDPSITCLSNIQLSNIVTEDASGQTQIQWTIRGGLPDTDANASYTVTGYGLIEYELAPGENTFTTNGPFTGYEFEINDGACFSTLNFPNSFGYPRYWAKLALEGLLQSDGTMTTALVDNALLPLNQPYNSAPYSYNGNESLVNGIPDNAVDWVLLELRDGNTNAILDRKAALVNKYGSIMDTNGVLGVSFENINQNDLIHRVVFRHRSHLAVMVPLFALPSYSQLNHYNDITENINSVEGTDQLKLVHGKYAMLAGDYDNNGTINFFDFMNWLGKNNILNTYDEVDADGNGTINFGDFLFWLGNLNQLGYSGI